MRSRGFERSGETWPVEECRLVTLCRETRPSTAGQIPSATSESSKGGHHLRGALVGSEQHLVVREWRIRVVKPRARWICCWRMHCADHIHVQRTLRTSYEQPQGINGNLPMIVALELSRVV
jgi:hypothetical protein